MLYLCGKLESLHVARQLYPITLLSREDSMTVGCPHTGSTPQRRDEQELACSGADDREIPIARRKSSETTCSTSFPSSSRDMLLLGRVQVVLRVHT